ncbi:MAG: DNA-binding protein [Thiomonas sp.]
MKTNHIPDLESMPPSAVLNTADAARALMKSGQTLRKLYCMQGHAYGIKPLKIGQRLAWRVSDLLRVLQGGAQ